MRDQLQALGYVEVSMTTDTEYEDFDNTEIDARVSVVADEYESDTHSYVGPEAVDSVEYEPATSFGIHALPSLPVPDPIGHFSWSGIDADEMAISPPFPAADIRPAVDDTIDPYTEDCPVDDDSASDVDIISELVDGDPSDIDAALSSFEDYDDNELCETLCVRYDNLDSTELDPIDVLNAYQALKYAEERSLDECADDLRSEVTAAFESLGVTLSSDDTEEDSISVDEAKEFLEEWEDRLRGATEEVYDDPDTDPYAGAIESSSRSYLGKLLREFSLSYEF